MKAGAWVVMRVCEWAVGKAAMRVGKKVDEKVVGMVVVLAWMMVGSSAGQLVAWRAVTRVDEKDEMWAGKMDEMKVELMVVTTAVWMVVWLGVLLADLLVASMDEMSAA